MPIDTVHQAPSGMEDTAMSKMMEDFAFGSLLIPRF